MSTNRNRIFALIAILGFCAIQTGCTKATAESTETEYLEMTEESSGTEAVETASEVEQDEDATVEDEQEEDTTPEYDMEGWIGKYEFYEYFEDEGYAPQCMDYDIDIYKEAGQYYADVEISGHMVGASLKAKLYGNEEWVSLVIQEYYPDHICGFSSSENNVLVSLRKQGEDIYTYWGVLTPLGEDVNYESGNIYLEKTEDSVNTDEEEADDDSQSESQPESFEVINNMEWWIGEYTFEEYTSEDESALQKMDYDIQIYEEDGQYYADMVIIGSDTNIDVKAQVYGDEEWISLVLVGYNPGHAAGLEGMENSVLLSMRRKNDNIYTYWGESRVTQLLLNRDMLYYDSNSFFEKVVDER